MKELINHHVHTTGSDGKLSPEDTIKLAIENGLTFICFTDHYPYPPWIDDKVGKDFHSNEYYKEIEKVKNFKDKIEFSFGAEIEWFPENEAWIKSEIKKRRFDYVLGAIHHIGKEREWGIGSEEDFNNAIKKFGNIKGVIKNYYERVRSMVKSNIFDCIAHFDYIKIWNFDSQYFSQEDDWYKKEVLKTLDEVEKSKICIEINTSGWRRKCKEQYPSLWILKEMKKRDIPITIGSDSHYKENIIENLEKAIVIAKQAGYTSIVKFKERKMIEVKI